MKGLRIYADELGESHVEDLTFEMTEEDFAPPAAPLFVSAPQDAAKVVFCTLPRNWDGNWHPTPARQYFVLLSGLLEWEVSDGNVGRVRPGEFVLLEDTSGKGHVTRVACDTAATGMLVQLRD